ncbi:rhamnogalacturonan acetylesterase [Robertkochia solimangrovi]|uniref:rhamnogalacturonan acetylesterase n=1 Tax=Robertkochia solimangrovi TaxID=2213046 RepID=UPI00117F55AC|nr:rhamnogalacturonan acetylesterase [Robertkochia solimangrovi]TRZ46481.1 rhamnogalacturonan acetylesterase [Robertkochia solimangrovi]
MIRIRKQTILLLMVLISCTVLRAQEVTLYTCGDSTMADKSKPEINPEKGWGQLLPEFFSDRIRIENHAVNGRSTRSFIDEGRWEKVYNMLKKGDYVFIQFGHNDQKDQDPKRYTNPHTAYRYNLRKMVEETREKGATPVLLSSIVRRNFNEKGVLIDTHGDYPMEMRLLAQEMDVLFIDLQYLTEKLEIKYGPEGSAKLHLHFEPGETDYYPNGKSDDTHLSVTGAREIAGLVVKKLKESELSLKNYLK